jgi:hypothetical protein
MMTRIQEARPRGENRRLACAAEARIRSGNEVAARCATSASHQGYFHHAPTEVAENLPKMGANGDNDT